MDTEKELCKVRIEANLPYLVEMLLAERGQGFSLSLSSKVPDVPPDPLEQWNLFRALVNTRPPEAVSEELLRLQDDVLQDILAYRGVTSLEDIPDLPGMSHLKLWRGDITTLATDAIVNAANSQMLGCFVPGHHCIDNAIHTFAGIQLRLACARLMEAQGYPESTGMAKVTDAFNLPSKYVIHTVGPIAKGFASETDQALLANCYTACLEAATDAGCESLAFCCISTGVFGFPQKAAAKIAISTVDQWMQQAESPMNVVFNVFSEKDEQLYKSLLH